MEKKQNYTIEPYYIPHWGDEEIYWKVHSISKDEQKTGVSFFATSALDGMVSELASLEYLHDIENDAGKHEEYGLKKCLSYFKLDTLDTNEANSLICIGKSNFNQTKKYFWPKNSDKVYLTNTYLFNRYNNNIFTRINKSLFFPDKQKIDFFTVHFSKTITKNYPLLFANDRSVLEFNLIESTEGEAWWKIKLQSDEISKKASSAPQLFGGFKLAFVATGEIPKTLRKPTVRVTFHKRGDKKDSKEKSESYKLWNTPYPKNIRFVPDQAEKKDRRSHFVAASQHHWGVYSKYDFEKIKTELQYIEDAIRAANKKGEYEKKEESKKRKVLEKSEQKENESMTSDNQLLK